MTLQTPWILTVCLLLITVCSASAREWTDNTGKYSVEAELVEVKGDDVVLKKATGSVITVPIARLSKTDQEYLQSLDKPGQKPLDDSPEAAKVITNSIGMRLTPVPAGKSMMGSGESAEELSKWFQQDPATPDFVKEHVTPDRFTLAAGEHWYTRWNVKPFLDRGIVSFVQSDPELCGGIGEWLKIWELFKAYPGVQVIPHGHHVLAASTCVASQPEALCPMLECLIRSRIRFQHCQTRPMVAEAGTFAMAEEPGLGPSLDEVKMEPV